MRSKSGCRVCARLLLLLSRGAAPMAHVAAFAAMLSSSMVVLGATAAEPWSVAQGVSNGPFTFFVRGRPS